MNRHGADFWRRIFLLAAVSWLISGSPSLANNDTWDTAVSGTWQTGSNWLDNSAPGNADEATFNLAGTYTVTFNGTPFAIRALTLTGAANVTFTSIGPFAGEVGTLRVNSGGTQDVLITNGTNLTLGTGSLINLKPLHLTVGDVLTVNTGSTLTVRSSSDVITTNLTNSGQLNVTGSGSTLNVSNPILINSGSLNVTAGGLVTGSSFASIGEVAGTITAATVSGTGSQWNLSNALYVGDDAEGRLNITAGGKIQSLAGFVGLSDTAVGNVSVSGAGSQWNNSTSLVIGFDGSGTLNVTGGGSVSSIDGVLGSSNGSNGTATLTGGNWTMSGRLSVGGQEGSFFCCGQGTLDIQPAGTVNVAQGVLLLPDGLVRLRGGTLDTSAFSFQGGGQFDWTSGTLHVGTFNGSLTNESGVLAPGHSAGQTTIAGNYTQSPGAVLQIEIGGPLAVSQFDFVNVMGNALIGGELELTLINGFIPTAGQTFAILIADSVAGTFDNADNGQRVLTSDGGGSFIVHYGVGSTLDPAQIILTNFLPGLPGDCDDDNDVDLDDYVLFPNCLDGPGVPFGLVECNCIDCNTDDDVDLRDFADFQSGFTGP